MFCDATGIFNQCKLMIEKHCTYLLTSRAVDRLNLHVGPVNPFTPDANLAIAALYCACTYTIRHREFGSTPPFVSVPDSMRLAGHWLRINDQGCLIKVTLTGGLTFGEMQ
jgi:hypothetical protein